MIGVCGICVRVAILVFGVVGIGGVSVILVWVGLLCCVSCVSGNEVDLDGLNGVVFHIGVVCMYGVCIGGGGVHVGSVDVDVVGVLGGVYVGVGGVAM